MSQGQTRVPRKLAFLTTHPIKRVSVECLSLRIDSFNKTKRKVWGSVQRKNDLPYTKDNRFSCLRGLDGDSSGAQGTPSDSVSSPGLYIPRWHSILSSLTSTTVSSGVHVLPFQWCPELVSLRARSGGQDLGCNYFIWETIPEHTDKGLGSETGKGEKQQGVSYPPEEVLVWKRVETFQKAMRCSFQVHPPEMGGWAIHPLLPCLLVYRLLQGNWILESRL